MLKPLDILKISDFADVDINLELCSQKEQNIPGLFNYSIRQYISRQVIPAEETGMMVYHYNRIDTESNFFELKFCSSTGRYCEDRNCTKCNSNPAKECNSSIQAVNVYSFHFTPTFLSQFVSGVEAFEKKEKVFSFQHPSSFTKIFPVCNRKRSILDALADNNYTGALENLFVNIKVQELLLHSVDCLVEEKEEGFTCKFLANQSDRDKIMHARDVLLQHLGDPITIKELSRKVAINECYLKKGFKEIFGTTIFEFYQQQRMEHARYLLYEKGLSVTDVSAILGYSSISHFSTAFKKHTGLKPCDLLLR